MIENKHPTSGVPKHFKGYENDSSLPLTLQGWKGSYVGLRGD